MILSNVRIQEAMDEGSLIIDPVPEPKTPVTGISDCPYQTSAVDLRLGDEISWIKEDLPVNLDLTEGKLDKLLINNCHSRQLTNESPFVLQPNKFVLGRTLERIHLPIREAGQCLAARIEGRSSYARCGLLVHFTAPTIHTGFDGTITLEIMNLGKYSIVLKPFIYICQLIIERVEGKPFRNDSQFQGQMSQLGPTE